MSGLELILYSSYVLLMLRMCELYNLRNDLDFLAIHTTVFNVPAYSLPMLYLCTAYITPSNAYPLCALSARSRL